MLPQWLHACIDPCTCLSTLTRAALEARRARRTSPPFKKPPAVRILEVGPRDGLQNIKKTVPTAIKVELIKRLASTGLNAIEATSFVSPKWIPQLADGPEVMSQVLPFTQQKNINTPVLVPNIKGLERAIQSGAKEVTVFVSATEGFSVKNTNCTIEEAVKRARDVAASALKHGIAIRGAVSCIFACPYDGPTAPASVLDVVKSLLDMGCYEVSLGDTIGVGTPKQVQTLLELLLKEIPANMLAGHFHDTYGQAVANVIKAYDMGLQTFDSSVAGLGGCPYAKGAKGNLATEDIAYTFEKLGVSTGIDLEKLVAVGEWISQYLGQQNGSRAGSALSAKKESATVSSVQPSQPKISREWEKIEDKGDYSVFRARNVVKIRLTRPQNGNAMTSEMVKGLTQIFTNLASDPSVFHVVIETEGKFFCTGMDLTSTATTITSDNSAKSNDFSKLTALFSAIDMAPQTTIAKIDGPCFGGGVGLAFACDIRLVSSRARFTLSEIKLGLSPAVISRYMIREWGIPFLREAMLTGREVMPSELQRIGAVHGIADGSTALDRLTEDCLDRLIKCAPQSAAACKNLVRIGWTNPGGKSQDELVMKTFDCMMAPGSEGVFGIEEFQKKTREINWGHFWAAKRAMS
ncbi:hydroxymethylglutaryl-lyase [Mytilinidion resinicola]|uniref:hydroxymethylglutaryl-CoA lyase n=1 Tax=Mytilinidion resinicola TaxID=574789 RepID=A0A6A6YFD9_9PEZI|nr:hydroxymethylglutaryl-lyase [Mytilinidion resinicola]KAF2806775.1 hydroxymethylglutaryl-lyase [Mytilinidion resinicola]